MLSIYKFQWPILFFSVYYPVDCDRVCDNCMHLLSSKRRRLQVTPVHVS